LPIASEDAATLIKRVSNNDSFSICLASDVAQAAVAGSSGSAEPFYKLPLSETEKRLIEEIITTLAAKNVVQLAFEKRSLEKKGKKVTPVHPLRFIGFILANSELRSDLKIVKKSSFKWDAFVDGFSKRMREELSKNNVYQHVPGFCEQVGTTPDRVIHYIQKKEFEELIKSLM